MCNEITGFELFIVYNIDSEYYNWSPTENNIFTYTDSTDKNYPRHRYSQDRDQLEVLKIVYNIYLYLTAALGIVQNLRFLVLYM